MLRLAVICLLIALVMAVFGFGGLAGTFMQAAKILFFVFIAIALISAVGGALRGL